MIWYRNLGSFEYILIGLFVLFYLLYIIRMIVMAHKMKSSARYVFIKFFIRSFYFSLLIIALLGPSFGDFKGEVKIQEKDIFLLVDLSMSMNATDITPSRLARAQYLTSKLINSFNTDRIGIIVFSDQAFVHCPLTYDEEALQLYSNALSTSMLPSSGTDINSALELALEKFKSDRNYEKDNSKVIILISDGEMLYPEESGIANRMQEENIYLFCLGIGTTEGSKIPSKKDFKKNKEGAYIITRLNEDYLKTMAENTGGSYFPVSAAGTDITRLVNQVNNIKGDFKTISKTDTSSNKYFYFLLIALLLIIFDILITVNTIRIS